MSPDKVIGPLEVEGERVWIRPDGLVEIESKSRPGLKYVIDPDAPAGAEDKCQCEGYMYNLRCRHVDLVDKFAGQWPGVPEDAETAEPKINLSEVPLTLYTSRYQWYRSIESSGAVPVGITLGNPRWKLKYPLVYCKDLAPDPYMMSIRDDDEFEEAYFNKLERVGVDHIRRKLQKIAYENDSRPLVLLCFENVYDPDPHKAACHRTSFARWWEQKTGEKVEELPEEISEKPQGKML